MFTRTCRPFSPAALSFLVFIILIARADHGAAQKTDGLLSGNIKYNSGQSVQPIFEGWTKVGDGYQLWFGYLNRNHVQEIHVPVGPENRIEPGGPDRGQPTYFYTRFNRQLFSVVVPSDFGQKQQVIWTVVANGQTERAVGWLRPDWEIAPPGAAGAGSFQRGENKNQPPSLEVTGSQPRIALADSLTLTATVMDDGLPPARPSRGRGGSTPNRPPAFENPEFKGAPPTNVPQVERPAPPRITDRLQVSWFIWRGPAAVVFNPSAVGADGGKAVVTATFSKPGEYVLRARATDGAAYTYQDYKITVSGS